MTRQQLDRIKRLETFAFPSEVVTIWGEGQTQAELHQQAERLRKNNPNADVTVIRWMTRDEAKARGWV